MAERLLVNADQDDILADGPFIDMVANDAQPVFGIFAGADEAEEQSEDDCPAKQTCRPFSPRFPGVAAQPAHGRQSFSTPPRPCPEKGLQIGNLVGFNHRSTI
jgi:hypothetical protein